MHKSDNDSIEKLTILIYTEHRKRLRDGQRALNVALYGV